MFCLTITLLSVFILKWIFSSLLSSSPSSLSFLSSYLFSLSLFPPFLSSFLPSFLFSFLLPHHAIIFLISLISSTVSCLNIYCSPFCLSFSSLHLNLNSNSAFVLIAYYNMIIGNNIIQKNKSDNNIILIDNNIFCPYRFM